MDGQHAVPPDGVEHDGLTELDAVDLAKLVKRPGKTGGGGSG
jgi:hypothetical protein